MLRGGGQQQAVDGADVVMDAKTLSQVQMPNRDGFVLAPRVDLPTR